MPNTAHGPVLVLACLTLALTACSTSPEPPKPQGFTFDTVIDQTGTGFYTVGTTARGVSDQFGDRLTLDININHANSITFSPVATIIYTNGTTLICEETDPRRHPSLVETTTTAEIPCDGSFPDDVDGASVTVIDNYNE
jgi:hypothetical protein